MRHTILPLARKNRTMPQPAILFRFHKAFDVCLQNVRHLRRLNPGVPIHGLYGGAGACKAVPTELAEALDSLYFLPFEDAAYNWKNGDICIRWWFKKRGVQLDFTHLCVVEWDLYYLKPLPELFDGLPEGVNWLALSGPYRKMVEEGWPWIQGFYQRAFDALVEEIGSEKPLDLESLSFGIYGGAVLCRPFLEALADRPVRSYCNDEVRATLYAHLFGTPIRDSGFLTDKRNLFNAENEEYTEADIARVRARDGNAIHPIRVLLGEA